MPGTVANLFHEPVWIVYNSVLLGLAAEGDVTVTWNEEYVDQMSHQTGVHILESYHKGGAPTIDIDIAEVNNPDNWIVAFAAAQKQVDTDTTPNTRVASGSLTANAPFVGTKASSIAQTLVLRPQALYTDTSTETVRDLVFPKAWCRNAGDVLFGIDSANTVPMTFGVLYDPAVTEGEYEWIRGLETAVAGTWAAA